MELEKNSLRILVQRLGVSMQVSKVLFAAFPESSFDKHITLFQSALSHPNSLKPFIHDLQMQLNTGATSHTAITMRHFLDMDDKFEIFTRDYVRRCCDMVEWTMKHRVVLRLHLVADVSQQPLGGVIRAFGRYSDRFPEGLLDTLALFNLAIYRPAKHEPVSREDEHIFSVADAIAVTFIAVSLCKRLDDFQRKYPFG